MNNSAAPALGGELETENLMPAQTSPIIRRLLAGGACAMLLASPALAMPGQGKHHKMMGCSQAGMLTISGHGESRVAPDQLMISLGVTTEAPTAAEAMRANSERQTAVIDTLKQAGIGEDDIQTQGLTLNPMMNYPEDGTAPSINGYMAQNLLTVRVTDIARAGEVLDSIVGAGANEMQGIRFIRDDSQSTEDEALSRAVTNATHRASVMAEAAGVQLGPILRMGEPDNTMAPPAPVMMRAMDAGAENKSIPVEGGEVAFTADVEVTFALSGGDCAMPHWRGKDMRKPGQPGPKGGPAPIESPVSPMPSAGKAGDAPDGQDQPASGVDEAKTPDTAQPDAKAPVITPAPASEAAPSADTPVTEAAPDATPAADAAAEAPDAEAPASDTPASDTPAGTTDAPSDAAAQDTQPETPEADSGDAASDADAPSASNPVAPAN